MEMQPMKFIFVEFHVSVTIHHLPIYGLQTAIK